MIATNTTEPSGPPDTPPSAFRRDSALSYSSPAPSLSRRPKPRSTAPTLRERFQNSVSSTRPFRRSYPQSPFDSQPDYPHVDEAERSAYDTEAASLRAKVSGFDLKVCEMQRTQRKLNTLFEALRTETEDLRQREEELREQIRSSEGGGESAQADLEMRGDGEAETEETERDRGVGGMHDKGKIAAGHKEICRKDSSATFDLGNNVSASMITPNHACLCDSDDTFAPTMSASSRPYGAATQHPKAAPTDWRQTQAVTEDELDALVREWVDWVAVVSPQSVYSFDPPLLKEMPKPMAVGAW